MSKQGVCVDIVPAAIPYICQALNELMMRREVFGADDLLAAIEASLPSELTEFSMPGFMRVIAGLQFAADGDLFLDLEPIQTAYSMEGALQRSVNPSYLRACLLVPVRFAAAPGGQERASIDPRALLSIARQIERGEPVTAGMLLH